MKGGYKMEQLREELKDVLLNTISTAAAHHKSDKLEKKISDLQNELDILKGVNEKE